MFWVAYKENCSCSGGNMPARMGLLAFGGQPRAEAKQREMVVAGATSREAPAALGRPELPASSSAALGEQALPSRAEPCAEAALAAAAGASDAASLALLPLLLMGFALALRLGVVVLLLLAAPMLLLALLWRRIPPTKLPAGASATSLLAALLAPASGASPCCRWSCWCRAGATGLAIGLPPKPRSKLPKPKKALSELPCPARAAKGLVKGVAGPASLGMCTACPAACLPSPAAGAGAPPGGSWATEPPRVRSKALAAGPPPPPAVPAAPPLPACGSDSIARAAADGPLALVASWRCAPSAKVACRRSPPARCRLAPVCMPCRRSKQ